MFNLESEYPVMTKYTPVTEKNFFQRDEATIHSQYTKDGIMVVSINDDIAL